MREATEYSAFLRELEQDDAAIVVAGMPDHSYEPLAACTAPAHERYTAETPCYYIDEGGCGDFFDTQLKLFVWGVDRAGPVARASRGRGCVW